MPMAARVLDGRAVAAAIRAELADEVERLAGAGRRPTLAAVLVGDDEASHIYVGSKQRAAERSGIGSRRVELPADAAQKDVLAAVAELNADEGVHGILVQLPLPDGLDPVEVQDAIDPAKDVDGLHPENEGRLLRGDPRFAPCTAIGIVELLRRERVPVEGSHVVIVGRGLLVGPAPGRAAVGQGAGGQRHRHPVPHRHQRPVRVHQAGRRAGGGGGPARP